MKKTKVIFFLSFLCWAANAAITYKVTALGNLGAGSAVATDINNNGQTVGRSQTIAGPNHAFIWQNGIMQDIGTLGTLSTANAINSSGSVVGYSTLTNGDFHAFLYDATNGMQDLGALGGYGSQAFGINDSRQIVGSTWNNNTGIRPFVYSNGVALEVSTLGHADSAIAINNSGIIVGVMWNTNGTANTSFMSIGGFIFDLGTFGDGSGNEAVAINTNGFVVGSAGGNGFTHAYFYDGFIKHDLGTLGGSQSIANDINNEGIIVGDSTIGPGGTHHAWIFQSGIIQDLNGLVDTNGAALFAGNGEYLVTATAINDNGLIVANSSKSRAYLLTPQTPLAISKSGANIIVSWPSPSLGFVLQENTNLANTNGWTNYGGTVSSNSTTLSVTLTPTTGQKFYRLKK
jgi:probable HAF family extracellular repeat protein